MKLTIIEQNDTVNNYDDLVKCLETFFKTNKTTTSIGGWRVVKGNSRDRYDAYIKYKQDYVIMLDRNDDDIYEDEKGWAVLMEQDQDDFLSGAYDIVVDTVERLFPNETVYIGY